ncbi:MAG: CRP/FNR family transcriptional activator FtrB [Paracoccaceae bacterium]
MININPEDDRIMRPADLPKIRALPLFADVKQENFETLVRGAYVQNFPPQVELISEGDSCDFLHVVIEGSVELFASWNGRETVMATIHPVSMFILAATIKDAPYLMSGRTLEKSRVILLPSQDVRSVFGKDNQFARAVVTELAECYRSVVRNSKDLRLRTSVERLANYVLRNGKNGPFDLSMEKRRLASYLNMTPENLSRAIKILQSNGVQIDASRVQIVDAVALTNFAKPTVLIDGPMD